MYNPDIFQFQFKSINHGKIQTLRRCQREREERGRGREGEGEREREREAAIVQSKYLRSLSCLCSFHTLNI